MTKNEKEKLAATEAAASLKKLAATCKYVPVSSLVPPGWKDWFWSLISENAPFTWGDNNRSLVDFVTFADHCEERLDGCPDAPRTAKRWLEKLQAMAAVATKKRIYVDMEN